MIVLTVKQKCMSQLLIDVPEPASKPAETEIYPNRYTAIPPNGRICHHTGLKHAQLYKLLAQNGAARPYVKVANLKVPGASKGKTIFHVGDMLRFLDGLARHQGSGTQKMEGN